MKRVIGSILCLAAIGVMFDKMVGQKPETAAERSQDWALIGVLLAIGIALSTGKKKAEGAEKK